MSNIKQQDLINSMKRNTDNMFYISLVKFLELRISLMKDMLVTAYEVDEVRKIQGRVLELQEFLKSLQRVPVDTQHTGSFD